MLDGRNTISSPSVRFEQHLKHELARPEDSPEMEKVKHAVSVHPYRPADGRRIRLEATSRMNYFSNRRRRHSITVAIARGLSSSTTDSRLNVVAGFCGVARFTEVGSVLFRDLGRAARVASQSLRIRAIARVVKEMLPIGCGCRGIILFTGSISGRWLHCIASDSIREFVVASGGPFALAAMG